MNICELNDCIGSKLVGRDHYLKQAVKVRKIARPRNQHGKRGPGDAENAACVVQAGCKIAAAKHGALANAVEPDGLVGTLRTHERERK